MARVSVRRHTILAALREAGAGGVSGETVACELGVSRTAVAKHVNSLRELGYEIEAVPGWGYRLLSTPDLPIPEEVLPRLHPGFWTHLEGGGISVSTNDECKDLARRGAPEGTAVLASSQTGGRGRLGRRWSSPQGGVYVSAILRPALAPGDIPPLALVVSLGVARGLAHLGVPARLKWPNDVVSADPPWPKLAGVLLETAAEADRVEWVVAGVGVNVRPSGRRFAGAAYAEDVAGGRVALAEVAAAVLDGLAGAYSEFVAGGFSPLREEYESLLVLVGGDVTVSDATGRVVAEGRVEGVDDQGRLLLDGPAGRVGAVAGEVTLRREADPRREAHQRREADPDGPR